MDFVIEELNSLTSLFILQVDFATVITKKMLKAAMKHIEVIAKARQKGKWFYVFNDHFAILKCIMPVPRIA